LLPAHWRHRKQRDSPEAIIAEMVAARTSERQAG